MVKKLLTLCFISLMAFASQDNKSKVAQYTHPETTYRKCLLCRNLIQSENIDEHMQTHIFSCTHCIRSFKQVDDFRSHLVAYHTIERTPKCDRIDTVCQYAAITFCIMWVAYELFLKSVSY